MITEDESNEDDCTAGTAGEKVPDMTVGPSDEDFAAAALGSDERTSGRPGVARSADELPSLLPPSTANMPWMLGALARCMNAKRDKSPYDYQGDRWGWEAGWDWQDREIDSGRQSGGLAAAELDDARR